MGSGSFRNVALIAHVDHGKTTLVDAMLRATAVFADHQAQVERVMDSGDQERERGITILAKAASIVWKGTRINLVDTPGHADFGGEVERALTMVDGVLLLVDASEGPMPQTRYVLSKALARHLPAVVVVNKVDRADARLDQVVDETYQLFFDLDAKDHHIDFPIVSTVARLGRSVAGTGVPADDADMSALLDTIVATIPAPAGDPEAPLQALVTNLDASDYLGRLAIGRVAQGTLRAGEDVALCQDDPGEAPRRRRLTQLLGFTGLGRDPVDERVAGDLFVVAGFPEVEIGDTLADPDDPRPLPRIEVDEPVLRMTFGVNTSPMAGSDGTYLTSRQIRERLEREVRGNVSIRIGPTSSPEVIEVAGRGELQLAVLIESMRREGYEFQVSRPEVILRELDGGPHEPVERAVIDVPDDHVGTVTQSVAPRKGRVTDLRPGGAGRTIVTVEAPARGLLGLRSLLMTATRGTALGAPAPRRVDAVGGGAAPPDGRRHGGRPSWRGDRLRPRQPAEAGRAVRRAGYRGLRGDGRRRGVPSRGDGGQRHPRQAADQHPHPLQGRGDQARPGPPAHPGDRHRVDRRRRAGRGHPEGDPGAQAAPQRE